MRRRYPILRALAAQAGAVLGLAVLVLAANRLGGFGPPPAWVLLAGQSFLALALGVWSGLRGGWRWFHAGFAPALVLLHAAALPSWVWLAGFLLVLLLHWNSFRHGVPLYLTDASANRALAALLRERPEGFRFIDLGSGLAGTLRHLARVYPKSNFIGVETAPLSFVLSWLRCLPLRNCRIRYRSLWREPLAGYDVVYCFLSPLPMPALAAKARAELAPSAWLVSNTFGIPGHAPDREVPLPGRRDARLLVWTTG